MFIKYKEFEDLLYLNNQSSHHNLGLLIDNKILFIHKQNNLDLGIATNIDIIKKAIN